MARTATKKEMFREIALAHVHGEVTIDELREIMEAHGLFSDLEPGQAEREWKNSQLRALSRMKYVNDDGEQVEIVNIKRGEKGADDRQNVFVWLHDATQVDLEWLIEDRGKREKYFGDEKRRYEAEYSDRYGKRALKKLQRRLQFGGEEDPGVN